MTRTKLQLQFASAEGREVTAWMPDFDNGLRAHRNQAEKGEGKGWVISTRGGLRVIGYWWKRDEALTAVEALTGVIPNELLDCTVPPSLDEAPNLILIRHNVRAAVLACCAPYVATVEEVTP